MQVAQGLAGQAALFAANVATSAGASNQVDTVQGGGGGGVEPAVVLLDHAGSIEGVLTAAELVGFVSQKISLESIHQREHELVQESQQLLMQPSPVQEEQEQEEEEEQQDEEDEDEDEELETSLEDRQGMLYENLVSEFKNRHSNEKEKKGGISASTGKARLKENSPTGGNTSADGDEKIRTKLLFNSSSVSAASGRGLTDQSNASPASASIAELFASSVEAGPSSDSSSATSVAIAAESAVNAITVGDVQSVYRSLLGGDLCESLVRRCGVAVLAKDGASSRVLDVLHKLTDFGGSDSGGEHVVVLMKAEPTTKKQRSDQQAAGVEEGAVLAVVEPLQLLRAVAGLVGVEAQETDTTRDQGPDSGRGVHGTEAVDRTEGATRGGKGASTIGAGRARVRGRVRRPSGTKSQASSSASADVPSAADDAPAASSGGVGSEACAGSGSDGKGLGLFGELSSLQSEGSSRSSWELELLGEEVMLECSMGQSGNLLVAPPPASPFATTGGGNGSKVHVFKCKVRFQENLHRLSLPLPFQGKCAGCVATLLQAVVGKGLARGGDHRKGLQVLQIKCVDDEGDEVMISGDEAMREVLEMAKRASMKTVNFTFTLSDFSPKQDPSSTRKSMALVLGSITNDQAMQLAAMAGLLGVVAIAAAYLLRRKPY
jgi:hypothetical protein